MEIKKSAKANLDDKKLTFTLIGLVVALFIVWRVFEYRSYDKQEYEAFARTVEVMDEEMEITKQEQPKPQVQAPKPQVTQIQVVEDDTEVEDIDINAEVDQDEVIEEYVYEAPEIEEEDLSFYSVFAVEGLELEFAFVERRILDVYERNGCTYAGDRNNPGLLSAAQLAQDTFSKKIFYALEHAILNSLR